MFCEYVETGEVPTDELDDPGVAEPEPLRWLLGQLWSCTDIMPRDVCDLVGLPQGSNYAMGVGAVLADGNAAHGA